MTTIHQVEDGFLSITKGAFDRIPVNFSEEFLAEAERVHDSFAEDALRVLVVAYKNMQKCRQTCLVRRLRQT